MPNLFHRLLNTRLPRAFWHSIQGLRAAWQSEAAIRMELILLPFLVVIALIAGPGEIEKILLIGTALLVLLVELLNTGLEKTIDRISSQRHPLSKIVKDVGSAAVFISMLIFLLAWIVILT